MNLQTLGKPRIGWRWPAALVLFLLGLAGFAMGVAPSERPDVAGADLLTKAYYSLGLFVVGGLDIGTPATGPLLGRAMLWIAYFGAPLLTASAVIEAVVRVMAPHRWQMRRLHDHVVIVGSGELAISFLRVLRSSHPSTPVVVVDEHVDAVREQELAQAFNVRVVIGNITHDFVQNGLRLDRAARVVLLGDSDFQSFEAASKMLRRFPHLESRLVLHCQRLRFLRSMEATTVGRLCITFNSYHLAAANLVKQQLIGHFKTTEARDVVVLAGFGRFGQTILEELQNLARDELDTVVIIDVDADRRVMVAEEQRRLGGNYRRVVLQGDISHPEVWRSLAESVDLSRDLPTVILGTGRAEDNLRTALWLKQSYPNAFVFARTNDKSELAVEVGSEHGIRNISIRQLVEDNIPASWLA